MSRYDEAVDAARKALEGYARAGGDDRDVEINAHAVLVLAHAFKGDRAGAQDWMTRLERTELGWRHKDYANARSLALARANLALGRWQAVLDALAQNKAFGMQVFLDNLLSGATFKGVSNWAWQELPRAYMAAKAMKELGRREDAKQGLDRLLRTPEAEANGEIFWLILFDRGSIAEDEGQVAEAIALFKRAIDVLETQRASINTEANKIGFIGNKQEVYARIVRLLLRTGEAERALEYAEAAKSRALVDMLATRLVDPRSLRATGDAAPALRTYLAAEQKLRQQAPVAGAAPERRRNAAQAAQALRQVAPELASLVSAGRPRLEQLRARLGPDETLLLYYFTDQEGVGFTLTRDALKAFPVSIAGLALQVQRWRDAIERRDDRATALSRTLYDRVMAPLMPGVTTGKLAVVPHGALHYVSFAALHDGRQYVADRFALRMLPSASVLEFLRPGEPRPAPMLVLGNPDRGDPAQDLPSAQAEAEAVSGASEGAKLLVRREATESAFVRLAADFPVLHVASHGKFDAQAPLASALMLARDAENDGNLTVAELYGLSMSADLVTLSACETGLGQVASGDDVVGLGRGFLYAGARSIVVSLWSVGDEATSYLMLRFYANLRSADKRQALRAAQLETRNRYPHPFFWGAFYLIGAER